MKETLPVQVVLKSGGGGPEAALDLSRLRRPQAGELPLLVSIDVVHEDNQGGREGVNGTVVRRQSCTMFVQSVLPYVTQSVWLSALVTR
jgi:hypothetical protein